MGTICILLGVILLILATLGGFFIAHAVIGNQLYMSLLALTPVNAYFIIVGACFAVGLLICLNLVMHGLTYNRVVKAHNILKQIIKH